MGATYFASDLHLTAVEDPIFDCFVEFLERVRADGSELYLLGDVFESWIGDDDDEDLGPAVAKALRAVTDAGVLVSFAHGNRDFLVGEHFAKTSGARLMAEVEMLGIGDRHILVLHGDTLCTDDLAYQQVRRTLRDPHWQAQFLSQPLAARRAFAQQARAESAAYTAVMASQIMDVNVASVEKLFDASRFDWMIHGHTHRPAIHELAAGRRRIVLGDWPRRGSWLRLDPSGAAELCFDGHSIGLIATDR